MADTRINALSTATSSVSDDFVPIDGTTNGTRKLSAYSPTFGGNATVGGTLTVNSTATSTIKSNLEVGDSLTDATRFINIIGAGSAKTFGLQFTGNNVLTRNTSNAVTTLTSVGQITLASSGSVNVTDTTASTSTSSGALVVSGGVGVAGAIYAGGALNVLRSGGDNQAVFGDGSRDTNIQMKSTGNVSGNVLAFDSGVRLTVGATTPFGAYVTLYNGVGINTATPSVALDVVGAIKCTTNITTGAPSGGTAASWRLGSVATVSPTSPNRTIEVDIGGTIYYIHAKTTNN